MPLHAQIEAAAGNMKLGGEGGGGGGGGEHRRCSIERAGSWEIWLILTNIVILNYTLGLNELVKRSYRGMMCRNVR